MVSETRYMRNDEVLGTVQTLSFDSIPIGHYDFVTTIYLGIRVYVVHADATTTEITAGTPVAIASGNSAGLKSATWDCPLTVILATDKIRVVVYGNEVNPPTLLLQTFDTEVLGETSLDAATWTVYYYLHRTGNIIVGYDYFFRYGISTSNSKVENFTHSTPAVSAPKIVMDGFSYVMQ
jgi:hypothetical protein